MKKIKKNFFFLLKAKKGIPEAGGGSVDKREQKQKENDIKKGANKTRTKTGKTGKLFGKVVCKRKYMSLWKTFDLSTGCGKLSTELSTLSCGKHKSYPQVDKCRPQDIVFSQISLIKGKPGKSQAEQRLQGF